MNHVLHEMGMTARADISLEMQARLALRRLCWPATGMNLYLVDLPADNARVIMLTWIDEHTSDLFYLGGSQIGFHGEQDEIMFKLGFKWNADS